MRSPALSLILLVGTVSFTGPVAQAAGRGAEDSLPAKMERARALFESHKYSEAAMLARQVLLQKPDGRGSNELRVLLCKAKADGADVGDPAAVYPDSSDPGYPNLMPPSAQPPEKISGRKPQFGSGARRGGPGQVIVTAVIDEDGCVQGSTVTRGLNEHANQNVLNAVRSWVFRPALVQGKPIKVPYQLSVSVGFD